MDFEIVPFAEKHRKAFYSINAEWIEKFFNLEKEDKRVLLDPEGAILAGGGAIFMAEDVSTGESIAAVSLVCRGEGSYELSKMGVRPEAQGRGIGRALVKSAIKCFQEKGGRELFLETSSTLQNAIGLYASLGFVQQTELRPGSKYARADVYMIWSPA
ncbi:MAG: GNAT family N-acetyltransferase [Opitutales bacterium]